MVTIARPLTDLRGPPRNAPRDRGSLLERNGRSWWVMFKILELDNTPSGSPIEVGDGFATREGALAAVKRHLKGFKASGHNPEGGYWWARDAEGLRKCWISTDGDGALDVASVEGSNRGRRGPSV